MPGLEPEHVALYLSLLGMERDAPTLGFLSEVVSAHLQRVPFENISKLWRLEREGLVGIPSPEQFLTGIERFHFGGTCYSNNYYLNELLRALGFSVRLCGADMSMADVHMVSIVSIEGAGYLVDVGYGAPFYDPIPLAQGRSWGVRLGRWSLEVSSSCSFGAWRVQQFWDGVYQHGYTAKSQPKTLEDFRPVIASSFHPQATFMRAVMLARFPPGRAIVIRNLTVTESDAERNVERRLVSREELCAEIERSFSIPEQIAAEALAGVPEPFGALD
ncbi:MAG TPA: arylamine N-acetyltransferase [Candidatus Acidoferrales bacterium]|nr:arylamine N-acetyltransferase [Candidatus Acidoferrales bacterium]